MLVSLMEMVLTRTMFCSYDFDFHHSGLSRQAISMNLHQVVGIYFEQTMTNRDSLK
uniref:Uncharacterized protein n=1 Tax=Nelumbo nucifera TaxID=4432 RepID=A0A822ZN45_NELNU|nr:TPA_asm: hypothetical protein HUJ06_003155 [Nelumbo nucifera]